MQNLFDGYPMAQEKPNTERPVPLPNVMNRTEVISHLNQIGEVFTLSMEATLGDAFPHIAGWPAETIPHTINGYQRFLTEIRSSSVGNVVAGYVIRFKQLLLIEFGEGVLEALESELITLHNNEIIRNEKGNGDAELTLWRVAYPSDTTNTPPTTFDLLSTFLLLMQMKNLIIRSSARKHLEKEEK
ncbi:hypothetical protein AB2K85_000684 [Escherichia coli]